MVTALMVEALNRMVLEFSDGTKTQRARSLPDPLTPEISEQNSTRKRSLLAKEKRKLEFVEVPLLKMIYAE